MDNPEDTPLPPDTPPPPEASEEQLRAEDATLQEMGEVAAEEMQAEWVDPAPPPEFIPAAAEPTYPHESVFASEQPEQPEPLEPPASQPVSSPPVLDLGEQPEFSELAEVAAEEMTAEAPVLAEMTAVAAEEQAAEEPGDAPPYTVMPPAQPTPRMQREAEHNRAFVELGQVAREDAALEEPPELRIEEADIDRMKFPDMGQAADMAGTLRGYLGEDREWRSALTSFFKELTAEVRQQRLELDLLRGELERSRL